MRLAIPIFFTSLMANAAATEDSTLKRWLQQGLGFLSSETPSPSQAGAAAIAKATVTELTPTNWQSELRARTDESPSNWLIQITGGNKTCGGRCGPLDANFNKTVALLATTPGHPHFGRINCDTSPVLCSTLFAGPPVLWYIAIPGIQAADQSRAPTPIYVKGLNATEPTPVQDMVDFHAKQTYLERKPVDSVMHPFDGVLARYGLNMPIGYGLYYLSLIPSWGMMLLVSFITRNMMSRRAQSQTRSIPHGQAPAAGGAAKKSTL